MLVEVGFIEEGWVETLHESLHEGLIPGVGDGFRGNQGGTRDPGQQGSVQVEIPPCPVGNQAFPRWWRGESGESRVMGRVRGLSCMSNLVGEGLVRPAFTRV